MFHALKSRGRRTLAAAVVALAVSAGLATFAYASIPDSGGVIHGCYKTSGGDLRVVDSATDSCKNGEAALNWSQTGPQGPQGPQGPAGPQGPEGSGHAFFATGSTTITHGLDEVVALTGLPAGTYLVWAPVIVVGDGDSGTNDVCEWKINGSQIDIPEGYTFMFDAKDDAFGRADMSDVVTLPSDNSSLSVVCDTNEHGADAHGQIIALKVGSLN
jgi:hypothetical protein